MGWAGEVQKQKILPREHQMKKIHAMAQENHTRNLITKNSCGSKIPQPPPPTPPPPHNVFNGPSHDERCRIGDQNPCLARRLITNVIAEDSLIDWLNIDIRTHVFW